MPIRHLRTSALLILLLAVSTGGAAELKPFPDEPIAPPLVLPDLYGNRHDLNDYRGKVVLVNYWATWCPPCVHEMPSMQALKDKLAGTPFAILAVNMGEDADTVKRFQDKMETNFDILLDEDGTALRSWRVYVFPTSFLIGPEGKIRYGIKGALEWDADSVVKTIAALAPATDSRTVAGSKPAD